jgi:multimeric flavodoxin WrbA
MLASVFLNGDQAFAAGTFAAAGRIQGDALTLQDVQYSLAVVHGDKLVLIRMNNSHIVYNSSMSTQPQILFICGSPRAHTSRELLALIERGAREAGAHATRFMLSKKHIDPCTGCGSCSKDGVCVLVKQTQKSGRAKDDYAELLELLEQADALAVVAPLYFAGPCAQLKALFDRMQPYWAKRYILGQKPAPKRPAQLFILGGGGDAHGHEPLVTITKSSLAVAGFTVEKVQNFVGFKTAADTPQLPTEDEANNMPFGELAHMRKAVAAQKDFEQRAVAAGSAFARFALKSAEKIKLQASLKQIEAEIAELKEPRVATLGQSAQPGQTTQPEQSVQSGQPVQSVPPVLSDQSGLHLQATAETRDMLDALGAQGDGSDFIEAEYEAFKKSVKEK